LLVITLAATKSLCGQSYYFRHYQVEQGLSNNTVFCSAQDSRGFFWMGTKDGLNRFDGYSFKIFRNDPDDSSTIGDNFIRSLFISAGDTLYVGTRNGLYRYNALLENFSPLYETPAEVREIKKDVKGNLWFIAGQTLFRLDEKTGKIRIFQTQDYFSATSICIDGDGIVWVSTAQGMLQQYRASSDDFTGYDLFANSKQSSPQWIEKIFSMNGSVILAGTSNYGVKAFTLKDHTYTDLLTYNADRTGIFARDFIQPSKEEVWIATESGIFIYNNKTGLIKNLKKEYGNPYSISDNAVYSLCIDKEGGIWAGTYFGGVNYYPRQYVSFEKLFRGFDQYSLSGNAVREICEDRHGNLWIGTEDAGLNKLEKGTGRITHFLPTGSNGSISYSNIHGLLAQGDELWIGTFEHGLDIMNIKTGKVIRRFPSQTSSSQLRSNFFVVISQTRSGEIYAGTRQGLYHYNQSTRELEIVGQVPPNCFIHSIMEDSEGTVWVGTVGNGLFYFNPSDERSGNLFYQRGKRSGLTSNSVTTIFESSRKELWIGTEGGGLCKFNKKDSSFTQLTLKEGFPSNTIFKILEDVNQRLWITTSNGLVAFVPQTGSFDIYTTANGLLSNQFNYNSGYKSASGKMYFGSAKGLVSFDPGSFSKNRITPSVFITGFYLNDKELLPGKDSRLNEAISFTRSIQLKYNESSFSIDFAALSFIAPEMTQYKYITEGLDRDWTFIKTNRKVYFTNLAPGTYTFRVKAAGSNGIWTEQAAELVIRVLPPFWASPWAYALYVLAAIALFIFLVRSYHRRVKEKTRRKIEFLEHEKQKEIYQAKINFFTNIAHEIKTPLTLIKAPMEQISRKAGTESPFSYDLMIMQRNTDRLLELTTQLLDFRKMETTGYRLNFVLTNISEILLERYSSFKVLADQKGISINIQLPQEQVMAYADTDALQKILNNLFYNALNYCSKKVEIELLAVAASDNFITIEVRNDGRLVPSELKERIFEPFFRVTGNEDISGTGIGLPLSRSLADLHKGFLFMKEANGEMNIFVLRLPIHQIIDDRDH
jgi:ligand-binding sensor domain-containing protein/signal transduction histidine kinase